MKYLKWIPIIISLVAIAYFVTNNTTPASVYFTEDYQINNLPTGLLVIILLALGATLTILIVSVLGFQFWFREKRFQRQESKHLELWKKLQEIANLKTTGNYSQASAMANSLTKKYENPFLYCELAEILAETDLKQAVKTLELARQKFPNQPFILNQLAKLHEKNNPSLALDTLLNLIAITPGKEQVLKARELAISLERYDDAIILHNQCLELGVDQKAKETFKELELKKIIKFSDNLENDLIQFSKSNPKFAQSYSEIAKFYFSQQKFREAYEYFFKSFQIIPDQTIAEKAAESLYQLNSPEIFIAFARICQTALNTKDSNELIVKYFLKLGMYEEAEKMLSKIDNPSLSALCLLETSENKLAKEKLRLILQ